MGRSPCCEKTHTNKGAWTKEEDDRLISYIRTHGEGCWRTLPKAAGLLRCGKSCRLRWINYLRPDLKRGNFTQEEDELIIKLHSLLGNKWSLIAGKLPGRTDNEIKNYWNTHIKRKLLNHGIDPVTHRSISEPTTEMKTISFSKEEENKVASTTSCNAATNSNPIEENFVDLNLDLKISLPYQYQSEPIKREKRDNRGYNTTICFSCNLGIEKNEECNCKNISNDYCKVGYDFLGLRSGVLDFRGLEMK